MTAAVTFTDFVERVVGTTRLTPGQKVLVQVGIDGIEPATLEADARELAAQIFGTEVDEIPPEARAVLVAVCGARSGKSYLLGGLYSLWRGLTADLSSLAPGERASALIIAPDLRLARQALRYALGAAHSVKSIAALVEAEGADGFVIARPDGARVAIECLPATRGGSAVRGRSLVSAVLDECAFFRDESAVTNDVDVFRAVAPRVLAGGLTILASTPWTEAGLLHQEFSNNWNAPSRGLAAHAPTSLMRPDATTAALVARERARDESNAERELDARFVLGASSQFFPSEELSAAIDRNLAPRAAPEPGWSVVAGLDLGMTVDATAAVVLHVERATGRIVLADLLELRPKKKMGEPAPLLLSNVIPKVADLARRHGAHVIHADHHLLSEARSHLRGGCALRAVKGGSEAKARRHVRARTLIKEGLVRIPGVFSRVIQQLALVTTRPTPGGQTSIQLARRMGTHSDLAAALIVALGEVGRPHRFPWAAVHAATDAARAVERDRSDRASWNERALGRFGVTS